MQNQSSPSPTHQNKAPFQYHLSNKPQNLDDRRYCKSFVTLSKNSKSALFETYADDNTHHRIRECQSLIKAQDKLSNLYLALDASKDLENKLLLPTLQDFPGLSSLNVEISGSLRNDSICEKILFKSLTPLKNLNNLELSCYSLILDDPQILKIFMRTIRKLRKMSSFSLKLFYCSGQTPLHYDIILSKLTKMTQLRKLRLDLDTSEELDDFDIGIFTPALSKLSFLTQIDIVFEGLWAFEESTLLKFFTALQSMKNLTDLALDFSSCKFIYKYYETGSILESFKCLANTSIKKLRLGLFQIFTTKNLRELSAALQELNFLESLSLSFSSRSSLYEENFVDFGTALTCLASLTSLSLYFPTAFMNKNLIQAIASALISLQNLKALKLGFGSNHDIEDHNFQALFANFKHLKSLKYVGIQVAGQNTITDKFLEALSESLKELKLLKDLSLGFSSASRFTNKGLEALCSAIQESLSNLFSLSLRFDENNNINDKVISKLGEILQSLPLLYTVEIFFSRCMNIVDCKELFNALRERKNIQEIKLSIPDSEENSREVFDLGKIKKDLVVEFEKKF